LVPNALKLKLRPSLRATENFHTHAYKDQLIVLTF